jgi:hypothetical protein
LLLLGEFLAQLGREVVVNFRVVPILLELLDSGSEIGKAV